MNLHLTFKNGTISALTQKSFDSLPISRPDDLTFYKKEKYGEKYRYCESDYNYSPGHKEAFDKYFKRIDKTQKATKNEVIRFRCSNQLREQIERKSREEGKGMSEYLTDLVKKDLYEETRRGIKELNMDAVSKLYEELGFEGCNYEDDYRNNYLTENRARNGRTVLWYLDEIHEAAIYTDDLTFLSKEEIEEQLM